MSNPPRLLLVEDDASIQQLVRMALEELDIELLISSSLQDAMHLLRRGGIKLLITDLMLPDGSGLDLLQALSDDPGLLGSAPRVVFSAGLRPEVRAQLDAMQVWRVLSKPCSLVDLESCVREGLALAQARTGMAPRTTTDATALSADAQQAIATHFGGNQALFLAFRATCLDQFAEDLAQGDGAVQATDVSGLRRLAHSLKSVLLTLGERSASVEAQALEAAAEHADWAAAVELWPRLRVHLTRLARVAPPPSGPHEPA